MGGIGFPDFSGLVYLCVAVVVGPIAFLLIWLAVRRWNWDRPERNGTQGNSGSHLVAGENGEPKRGGHHILSQVVRFGLPLLGALLTGIYPGLVFVNHIISHSPVWLDLPVVVSLHIFFAGFGSFSGMVLYNLVSWRPPEVLDGVFGLVVALAVGILGMFLLALAYGA